MVQLSEQLPQREAMTAKWLAKCHTESTSYKFVVSADRGVCLKSSQSTNQIYDATAKSDMSLPALCHLSLVIFILSVSVKL